MTNKWYTLVNTSSGNKKTAWELVSMLAGDQFDWWCRKLCKVVTRNRRVWSCCYAVSAKLFSWSETFNHHKDTRNLRPHSCQVTEQLPLSDSFHSHQLVYFKASNVASSGNGALRHWGAHRWWMFHITLHSPCFVVRVRREQATLISDEFGEFISLNLMH